MNSTQDKGWVRGKLIVYSQGLLCYQTFTTYMLGMGFIHGSANISIKNYGQVPSSYCLIGSQKR